jgi:hypothetical protein
LLVGCGDDSRPADLDATPSLAEWEVIHEDLDGALMSVWGTSTRDVWAVGGDAGDGPIVIRWDGSDWTRLDTGTRGDLWWVHGFAGGPVFMGGKNGHILRYENGAFTPMATPTTDTVFGIWGAAPDEMWAVGGMDGGASGAFAWRRDGDAWIAAPGFPPELTDTKALWKVWGSSADDVWMVGTAAIALHWDGDEFVQVSLGGGESLFTVHHGGGRYAAVGGFATGLLFENAGAEWESFDGTPPLPPLVGIALGDDGSVQRAVCGRSAARYKCFR